MEDPYLYTDTEGSYHALFHAFTPRTAVTKGEGGLVFPGSHAFSLDGRAWVYTGAAYSNRVVFTDGTATLLARRERPHLVFADVNGEWACFRAFRCCAEQRSAIAKGGVL